jgi:hypothetical protein
MLIFGFSFGVEKVHQTDVQLLTCLKVHMNCFTQDSELVKNFIKVATE